MRNIYTACAGDKDELLESSKKNKRERGKARSNRAQR